MRGILPMSLLVNLFFALLLSQNAPIAADESLPQARPDAVGFSAERLELLNAHMATLINDGELAGAVTLLARHGRIVHRQVMGLRDLESGAEMTDDTIFRIYSMTKPVIGVAMMILLEEGKWKLDDPVHRYIPQFRNLKVDTGAAVLAEPVHAPTMRELMTHTAGFSYGVFADTPVDRIYRDRKVLDPDSSLEEMISKLADIPLLYQPGTRWVYSVSVDIQGYLVEKLSGQSLPEFLRERIFAPLGMEDTGFHVPENKRDRFAELYGYDNEKKRLQPVAGNQFGAGDYLSTPGQPSGGAGLVSTVGDYLRFSQMLLNGGNLGRTRILASATVAMLRANHLPPELVVSPGTGFGLDFAVTADPVRAGTLTGKGTYYWAGAAGTWFWIDPEYDIVFIGMIQRMGMGAPGNLIDLRHLYSTAIYGALTKPGK